MFELNVSDEELRAIGGRITDMFWAVRSDVQLAMGIAFEDVVRRNFGQIGVDRPLAWVPLSPAYARKVGRTFATLEVTGALKAAVRVDNSNLDFAKVYASNSDVPYAVVHQQGGKHMPQRPYFPMDDNGEVTDYAASQVREAAIQALREAFA